MGKEEKELKVLTGTSPTKRVDVAKLFKGGQIVDVVLVPFLGQVSVVLQFNSGAEAKQFFDGLEAAPI